MVAHVICENAQALDTESPVLVRDLLFLDYISYLPLIKEFLPL